MQKIHIVSRTCWINGWLAKWLFNHNKDFDIIFSPYSVSVGRNLSVEGFLETNADYLVQMDDDIYPLKDTQNIFVPNNDYVTYCGCPTQSLKGRHKDGQIVPNCMCIPRHILEEIQSNWFTPILNEKGSQWDTEESATFLNKIKNLGYSTKVVGEVGHISSMVARFDGDYIKINNPKWIE